MHGWVGPTTTPTGVTVRGNTITAEWGGVVVDLYTLSGTDPIMIEGNNISARNMAVHLWGTGGIPIEIRNNTLAGDRHAVAAMWTGHIYDWTNEQIFEGMSPLDIIGNDILVGGGERWYWLVDGIIVWGWVVSPTSPYLPPTLPPGADPAEWGDNGPVTISGNVLTCLPPTPGQFVSPIQIGRSGQGLNHSLVSNNTILGECSGGIHRWPYGGDNAIIGNDLSELTTTGPQIGVNAHDTTVAYNILGPALDSAALQVLSINWHASPDPIDTPMPRPVENCTITDNDYRGTGLPGWSEGWGAVLVASDVDLGFWDGVGTEVRNNFIFESGRFPESSGGAKKQIFELIVEPNPLVHDNRIVGLPANHTSDPSIGQRIKSMRREMMLQGMTKLGNKQ